MQNCSNSVASSFESWDTGLNKHKDEQNNPGFVVGAPPKDIKTPTINNNVIWLA